MRKIHDVPQGGGGDQGRDVWFRLALGDGAEEDYAVDHRQLEGLVRGLRHFAREAAKLRQSNGLGDAPSPPPTPVQRIECRGDDNGGLDLTFQLPHDERVSVSLSRPLVKRLLLGALTAMSPPASVS